MEFDSQQLLDIAHQLLKDFRERLARCGFQMDDDLQIVRGESHLCHYDSATRTICISFPSADTPQGQLALMVYTTLLGCQGPEELVEFLRVLLPWIVAHESAHHLRDRYGLMGDNAWFEEQVANEFASAMCKHRISPTDRNAIIARLTKAVTDISEQMHANRIASDTYLHPIHALHACGELTDDELAGIQMLDILLPLGPTRLLAASSRISAAARQQFAGRRSAIKDFNESYAANVIRYFYYQLSWMALGLQSKERHYLDELCRTYLGRDSAFLPAPSPLGASSSESTIRAYYRASLQCEGRDAAAAWYFYRRYRELLISRLKAEAFRLFSRSDWMRPEMEAFVTMWQGDHHEPLEYLAACAPPQWQHLFPQQIKEYERKAGGEEPQLVGTADQRLLSEAMRPGQDAAAAATLRMIALLKEVDIFNRLPPELLVPLAERLYRIDLKTGETLIWQGDEDEDLFIATDGNLDVLIEAGGVLRKCGAVAPGEVVGELGFLTMEPRKATIRASREATVYAIKSSELRLLATCQPRILLEIARTAAGRVK